MAVTTENAKQRLNYELPLLGALLVEPRETFDRIEMLIDADDFSDPALAKVFRSAASLMARGRFSVMGVQAALTNGGIVEAEAAGIIQQILALPAPVTEVEELARDVRAMADKARLMGVVRWCEQNVGDADITADEWQEMVEEALAMALKDRAPSRKAASFADGLDDWMGSVERREPLARGLSTGVRALDDMIGGYRPGDLVVIGGRPSMGKTILGTSAAVAAAEAGGGVFIASLEMPREQLRARVLCDLARDHHRVEYRSIFNNSLSGTDIAALKAAAERLKGLAIEVDDRGGLSAKQIALAARRAARRLHAQGKRLSMIVVDYLQLVAMAPEHRGDRNNGVGANSGALKQLAKDLEVPVILLSQLNRGVEGREDKRPSMSDLRDSGSIEQDADVVLFPFREEYYLQRAVEAAKNERDRLDAQAELSAAKKRILLIVEKQRNGPRGIVEADCDAGTSSIRDRGIIRPHAQEDMFGAAA